MKKRNIYLTGLFILVVLILVGVSYAYLKKSVVQSDSNDLNTLTCFEFSLADTDAENTGISLVNEYPVPDSEGLLNEPYKFTITNNCNTPIAVEINLETLSTSTLGKKYVKFNLYNGESNYSEVLDYKQTRTATISGATSNMLDKVYLYPTGEAGSSKNFELKLWVDEATTWDQGNSKTYQGKIVAVANPVKGEYVPEFEGESGTLLAAIKSGDYLFASSITVPGSEVSGISEAVIGKTTDDYGTSYYFRGNMLNNYVVFNNMCWRIVRIDGNGNIKLILQNERYSETGSCEVPGYSYNYARWDGSSTTTAFNNVEGVYNTASGSGFMYGDSTAQNFTDAQTNTTASTLLIRLQDWYDLKFTDSNVINNLADVIWCGDKSLNSGVGYGNTYSNYGAYLRLITQKAPSLKCPTSDKINGELGSLSKYTAQSSDGNGLLHREVAGETKYYPIGLITADEAAFAGGVYNVRNNTYYLYNGHYYWTMSPSNFYGGYARVWGVYSTGYLGGNGVPSGGGLRPAVSLKSTATISGGTGTVSDPYIISV